LLSRFRTPESMKAVRLHILNEHSAASEVRDLLAPLSSGEDAGFFSEAGMPCIADPGAALVAQAHLNGIRVVPVTGPSSILLALVASGLDAQRFVFLGYLPAEKGARKTAISRIARELALDRMTRLFIETPYRNEALVKDCLESLHQDTWLTIASDLCGTTQSVRSKTIRQWRSEPYIFAAKDPAVFAIGFPAGTKPRNTA